MSNTHSAVVQKNRIVQVRGEMNNPLLFMLDTETMVIEIKHHGVAYLVRVQDLIAFAQTSQRPVFRAALLVRDE